MIWCDFVNKYVSKKNAHYFSQYADAKEYLAAKRLSRKANQQARAEKKEKQKQKMEQKLERLDSYKIIKKSNYRENKERERKNQPFVKPANSVASRLRDKSNREPMRDEFEYAPKVDERSRYKQEKLNELVNLRRSDRVTRGARKNLDEQV
jgi:hypothetical protein